MTTRQRNRSAGEMDELPPPTTDDATAFTGDVMQPDANAIYQMQDDGHAIWVVPPPIVGQQVTYQVRRGHSIPMLVTAVHSPDLIDGVAFSARPSDVGNSYGSRGFQRRSSAARETANGSNLHQHRGLHSLSGA